MQSGDIKKFTPKSDLVGDDGTDLSPYKGTDVKVIKPCSDTEDRGKEPAWSVKAHDGVAFVALETELR